MTNTRRFNTIRKSVTSITLGPRVFRKLGILGRPTTKYDVDDLIPAAEAVNLPAVSFVKAVRYQTGRAGGFSDPLDEQNFLVTTINALEEPGAAAPHGNRNRVGRQRRRLRSSDEPDLQRLCL